MKSDINALAEPPDETLTPQDNQKNTSLYEKLTSSSSNQPNNSIIIEDSLTDSYQSFLIGNLPSNYTTKSQPKRYY